MKEKKRKKRQGHDVRLSKAMSWLLRHGAVKEGVEISDDGFVKMEDLMEHSSVAKHHPSLEDIMACVVSNDKKRFECKVVPEGEEPIIENLYIRAAQGHTITEIDEEKLLKRIEFPYGYPTLVHGTYQKVLEPILEDGL